MNNEITQVRQHIAEIGALMYQRRLTDAAGGNISVRVGERICITPRYAGSKHQWQLKPGQVMVTDLAGNPLEGEGTISREARVHFRLLNEIPEGQAVVHGHAQNVMAFCAAARPILPVLEDTLKFGEIPVTDFAPAHSAQLAEIICNKLRDQGERIRKQAAAVLVPWHGPFVLGKDLDAAFDALERIDLNAYILLHLPHLMHDTNMPPSEAGFDAHFSLNAAMARSTKGS